MESDGSILTVLGGGPAGLAAAYYARQRGLDVQVYEADAQVGGNARTLQMGPFRFDTGAHRLHDKIPHVTATFKKLLGSDLLRVHAPSQIYYQGQFIDFPLSPYDLLMKMEAGTLVRIALEQVGRLLPPREAPHNFQAMALQTYGPTLANRFLLNYSEKLWGVATDRLAVQVAGGRLQGLDLKTFLLEAFGGKRQKTKHLDGSFYYPKQGFGALFEAVADAIGREHIRCNARITELGHDGRRMTHIVLSGGEVIPIDTVINTLPLPVTMRLLNPAPPPRLQELTQSLPFQNLRLGVFGIDRPRLTSNASIYFPDRRLPFTRLYEPKNRSAHLAPASQTAAVVEVPCSASDVYWQMSDEELAANLKRWLVEIGLFAEEDVVAFQGYKAPFAYPVLEVDVKEKASRLLRHLRGFENLRVLGRGARFQYTHTHDLFAAARKVVGSL